MKQTKGHNTDDTSNFWAVVQFIIWWQRLFEECNVVDQVPLIIPITTGVWLPLQLVYGTSERQIAPNQLSK